MIVRTPAPGLLHQTIAKRLFLEFSALVASHRLGRVWFAPVDVKLSDTDVFQPDVLFVSHEREWIISDRFIDGTPDLLVEIISPGTARVDANEKRSTYHQTGVREYWLVDPATRSVEVIAFATSHRVVSTDRVSSFILPGFSTDLGSLFADYCAGAP